MGALFGLFFFLILIAVVTLVRSVRFVQQANVGLVERLGQYVGSHGPGMVILMPLIDSLRIVDMREQVLPLNPQSVITKDNITMKIDAVIYFQVTDPFKATYEITDLILAIENKALSNLRNIIGELSFDETLNSRDQINNKLQQILDNETHKWGLKVNRVEMKDIELPKDIAETLQKQSRAERDKRAAILIAEGEKQSAILKAEGEKEAAIRQAEGEKTSKILRAEADKQSAILKSEGEASAIRQVQQAEADMLYTVFTSIDKAQPSKEVLQVKYLEALEKVSQGQSNTLFLPYESIAFLGALAGSVRTVQSQSDKPHQPPKI